MASPKSNHPRQFFGITTAPQAPTKSAVQLAIEAAQLAALYGEAHYPNPWFNEPEKPYRGPERRQGIPRAEPGEYRHAGPQPFDNPARRERYDTIGSHRYAWFVAYQNGDVQTGTGQLEDMDRISALEQVNRWNEAARKVEQAAHDAVPESSRLFSCFWLL